MRTCVRVARGDDPARRPRRVLRVGRAAGRPRAARPAGDRRRRRRARGQLRGQGVRHPHGDGRRGRRGGCARTRSSCRRGCRPTPRRARRCSRCSRTRRRSSRGSRSTRRSSTCAGCGGSPGTPARDRRAAAARRSASEVGLPITVGVARTKFLAKVASAVAKPDGLLVVPPDGELAFLHPLPVERLWGVGPRRRPRSSTTCGIRTVGAGRRARRGDARRRCSAGRRAGICTRSRTTATRGRCSVGRRRRSIGSQRALGRAPRSLDGDRRDPRRRSSTGSRGGCAPAQPRLPHGRAAPALRRLHARDALAHAAAGDGADPDDPRHGARRCSRRRCRLIDGAGLTLVGLSLTQPRTTTAPVQLALPFDRLHDAALDAALDDVRDRFGSAAITRAVLLGRNPGVVMPLLPD